MATIPIESAILAEVRDLLEERGGVRLTDEALLLVIEGSGYAGDVAAGETGTDVLDGLANEMSRQLVQRNWPVNGDRLSTGELNGFYRLLRLRAEQAGWLSKHSKGD